MKSMKTSDMSCLAWVGQIGIELNKRGRTSVGMFHNAI